MAGIINVDNYEEYDIGTKAHNLFKMKQMGCNVPELFCLRDEELYENAKIDKIEIEKLVSGIDYEDADSINEASDKILKGFSKMELSDACVSELAEYLVKNCADTRLFSVRSSSSEEDSINNSYAGQFDTYLNVKREDIVDCIIRCLASAYKTNVLKYRGNHKSDSVRHIDVNIIIQRMIDSDISGVGFSVNPQGILNEMVLVCGMGTGDNVVEDKVPVTSYYYNTTDNNYYFESQKDAVTLSNEQVMKLVSEIKKLQAEFGEMIDIEYAYEKDKLYILQVRPITTIDKDRITILDNSNIVESYPGISLPLTDSFVRFAYSNVFRGVAYRCLKDDKLVKKYDEVFKQMVASANGRMYYKISNWYTVIKFLPFSSKIIPVWQDMLGVSNREYKQDKIDISLWQRIRVYLNSVYEAFHVQKGMERLNKEFKDVKKHFDDEFDSKNNKELVKLYGQIREALLKEWDITLLNDMYAFIFTGLLEKKLKKMGIKDYKLKTNKFISGITNIESMKPVRALIDIARYASEHICDGESDENANEHLKNMILEYIDSYGDRALEELKLESRTFRTDTGLVFDKINEYISDSDKLNNIYESMNREDESLNELLKSAGLINKLMLRFYSKKAMKGIRNREISRLNRSRVYGMVRTIFRAIGDNFAKEEIIDSMDDIFYLTMEEIFELVDAGRNVTDVCNLRKKEYEMYRHLPIYSRLIFAGDEFNKNHTNIGNTYVNSIDTIDELIGTPCSNGEVTGEIVVVNNPSDAVDVKDKIIVAGMTDPGWVFLLTLAKGIITKKGSLLSHTAIISRELKIPSIVGVENVTDILHDKDIVNMNGSTGKIKIIRRNTDAKIN